MNKVLLDTWHIVDGEWKHIYQIDLGAGKVGYYTDGKVEGAYQPVKDEEDE